MLALNAVSNIKRLLRQNNSQEISGDFHVYSYFQETTQHDQEDTQPPQHISKNMTSICSRSIATAMTTMCSTR